MYACALAIPFAHATIHAHPFVARACSIPGYIMLHILPRHLERSIIRSSIIFCGVLRHCRSDIPAKIEFVVCLCLGLLFISVCDERTPLPNGPASGDVSQFVNAKQNAPPRDTSHIDCRLFAREFVLFVADSLVVLVPVHAIRGRK